MTDNASSQSDLDIPALEAWCARQSLAVRPPLRARLIAGGYSNLTYRLDDAAGNCFVLRRPPGGVLAARTHNVGREFRILQALGPTSVPVPGVEILCEDPTIIGAPFYIMHWVDGTVIDSPEVASSALPTEALRRRASENIVDSLAALHLLDVRAIGLERLGPHEDFLGRQLERLHGVWEKTKTRELPLVESLYERLKARRPPQIHTGLVHSDYRIGNVMLDGQGRVMAVLDWELSAIGDVLADLGALLDNWDGPDDPWPGVWMREAPTRVPGFLSREEVVARYAQRSGFDVSDLDYYRAFGYWRIAVTGEGIKRRHVSGAVNAGVDIAVLEQRIQRRAALAEKFLRSWEDQGELR
jgi:aminoglycoside phosphotransferase (APT) family kinase protein